MHVTTAMPKTVWKRPIHLWDATANKPMRWRYYVAPHNAHNGALIECRWAKKIGTVIEVLNRENGRVLGTYVRGVHGVGFTPGRIQKQMLDKFLKELGNGRNRNQHQANGHQHAQT